MALFLDGCHDITLEVSWEPIGPGCWYISTPGFWDIRPVGVFVKIRRYNVHKTGWVSLAGLIFCV